MVSRIKSWMKKTALAATAAFALGGGYGCNVLIPEGEVIKADADGVITPDEEQQIIELMKKDKYEILLAKEDPANFRGINIYQKTPEGVKEFKGAIQNLVNDIDIMFANEFKERGLERGRIDGDLHIYMPEDRDELADKYKKTTFSPMPSYVGAFYAGNNTMYIPKGYDFPEFYSIFHHEEGHHLRHGAWEYASMANQIYSSLKLYALNRNLGTVVLNEGTCFLPVERAGSFETGFLQYYGLGCLAVTFIANRHNGNLELAMDYIMNAPQLHLDQIVQNLSNKRAVVDMRHAYLSEFESLLDQPGFRGSFKNLSENEFREFSDYLRLRVNSITAHSDFFERWDYLKDELMKIPDDLSWEEYAKASGEIMGRAGPRINKNLLSRVTMLAESFLSNSQNTSPYFRAMASLYLTENYDDLRVMLEDENFIYGETKERDKQIFELSKKIIELNLPYPCEHEPLTCPRELAEYSEPHLFAYANALYYGTKAAENANDYLNLVSIGEDFVDKFYPKRDFSIINKVWPMDFITQWVTFNTAEILFNAITNFEEDLPKAEYCKKAKQFYEYTKEASCQKIADEENRQKCVDLNGDYFSLPEIRIKQLGDCSRFIPVEGTED